MLRTNTNKYKANIKQYLIGCINYERTENCHDKGKLYYCSKMFIKEWVNPYEYRRQGGNVTKLLADWQDCAHKKQHCLDLIAGRPTA